MIGIKKTDPANVEGGNRRLALGVAISLALGVMLANGGRLATTPIASGLAILRALPSSALGVLRARLAIGAGGKPGSLASAGQQALAVAPLSYEPFVAAAAEGFRVRGATGTQRDAVLLAEAIRRNERAREVRVMAMQNALSSGQLDIAVDQLAVLTRLGYPAANDMIQALGKAMDTPDRVKQATTAFSAHPELYNAFLTGYASAKHSQLVTVALARGLPQKILADDDTRRMMIGLLVDSGAYGDARRLWKGGTTVTTSELLHSPDFSDVSALPPFGWKLSQDEVGAADPAPGRGVTISYYGRLDGPLISQLLTLPGGRYRVQLRYRTDSGKSGAVKLQLRCVSSGIALGSVPLGAMVDREEILRMAFSVPPSDCPSQTLALIGESDELRSAQDLTVRRIQIDQEPTR